MLRSMIGASIRFRFIVIARAAGLTVLGISELNRMHSDVLPETSPPTVRIQTEALGQSAPKVEALVTVPLEKNLLEGVMGVTDVTARSIPGLSDIDLHFGPGTSFYQAREPEGESGGGWRSTRSPAETPHEPGAEEKR